MSNIRFLKSAVVITDYDVANTLYSQMYRCLREWPGGTWKHRYDFLDAGAGTWVLHSGTPIYCDLPLSPIASLALGMAGFVLEDENGVKYLWKNYTPEIMGWVSTDSDNPYPVSARIAGHQDPEVL